MKLSFSFPLFFLTIAVFGGFVLGAFSIFSFLNEKSILTILTAREKLPPDMRNAFVAAQVHEPGMPDMPKTDVKVPVSKLATPTSSVAHTMVQNPKLPPSSSVFAADDAYCFQGNADRYSCLGKFYADFVKVDGPENAMAFVRTRYESVHSFYVSQCHQITHMIGRAATDRYGAVGEAYRHGDSFCWSGYYHGVMEGILSQIGPGVFEKLDSICVDIPGKDRYSFDYYNCVHGLGHGLMYILNDELFETLEKCDNLTGAWEQSSCWGGAFMENIIADEVNHKAKYLRADDPYYPCDAAAEKYKNTCYLMQTSRMLLLAGGDFATVFGECKAAADTAYIETCYQSLGRDASGRSVSNVEKTRATCMLGPDSMARRACIRGAAMDFISYHHSDVQAKELCAALDAELQSGCNATVESYYQRF